MNSAPRGLSAVKGGEDALIDLPGLAFTGKEWQDVRTALNRLPRDGYSASGMTLATDPQQWLRCSCNRFAQWLEVAARGGKRIFARHLAVGGAVRPGTARCLR